MVTDLLLMQWISLNCCIPAVSPPCSAVRDIHCVTEWNKLLSPMQTASWPFLHLLCQVKKMWMSQCRKERKNPKTALHGSDSQVRNRMCEEKHIADFIACEQLKSARHSDEKWIKNYQQLLTICWEVGIGSLLVPVSPAYLQLPQVTDACDLWLLTCKSYV